MELDELKHLFLLQSDKAQVKSSGKAIAAILKRRSATQTNALKKNLRIELVVAFAFMLFPLYIFVSHASISIKALAVIFFITAALFIYKIILLLKAIRRYERTTYAVKQRLSLLIDILSRCAGIYIQSTIIAFPMLFGVAALIVYLDNEHKDPLMYIATPLDTITIYVISSVLWCVSMYFFTKWYVKKLYGVHISQLQSRLKEMQ